jgi:hypothetical protein
MADSRSYDAKMATTVTYLTRTFRAAEQKLKEKEGWDNSKGTTLYQYQVDFCYLIDSIQRDPSYIAPKRIQEANELIANLEKEV